jgi:hypothetical protein
VGLPAPDSCRQAAGWPATAKCPVSGLAQAILRVQQRRGVVERAAELGTAACRSCFYSSTMDLLSHAASGYVQRQIHDPEELLRERERRKENGYAEAQAIDNPVAQEDGTTFEQEERGVRDGGASGHHVAKKTRLDGLPVWFPPKDKHGKWVITQSKAAHAVSSFPGMYRKNGDWNKYIETLKDNRTKDRAAMEDFLDELEGSILGRKDAQNESFKHLIHAAEGKGKTATLGVVDHCTVYVAGNDHPHDRHDPKQTLKRHWTKDDKEFCKTHKIVPAIEDHNSAIEGHKHAPVKRLSHGGKKCYCARLGCLSNDVGMTLKCNYQDAEGWPKYTEKAGCEWFHVWYKNIKGQLKAGDHITFHAVKRKGEGFGRASQLEVLTMLQLQQHHKHIHIKVHEDPDDFFKWLDEFRKDSWEVLCKKAIDELRDARSGRGCCQIM